MDNLMIQVRDLVMRLPSGGRELTILDGIAFDVEAGEVCAITGPSGSGKSTLVGLLAGLDRPTAGSIVVAGVELMRLGENALARFRRETLGYVFQSFHLIPTLTAAENVAVPLEIAGAPDTSARVRQLLDEVGLADRGHHYPVQLSGGEQQRVALARAVALRPKLLLADEPTGNLDSTTGAQII
jgi:putative ABC transport system ATP-binding protein